MLLSSMRRLELRDGRMLGQILWQFHHILWALEQNNMPKKKRAQDQLQEEFEEKGELIGSGRGMSDGSAARPVAAQRSHWDLEVASNTFASLNWLGCFQLLGADESVRPTLLCLAGSVTALFQDVASGSADTRDTMQFKRIGSLTRHLLNAATEAALPSCWSEALAEHSAHALAALEWRTDSKDPACVIRDAWFDAMYVSSRLATLADTATAGDGAIAASDTAINLVLPRLIACPPSFRGGRDVVPLLAALLTVHATGSLCRSSSATLTAALGAALIDGHDGQGPESWERRYVVDVLCSLAAAPLTQDVCNAARSDVSESWLELAERLTELATEFFHQRKLDPEMVRDVSIAVLLLHDRESPDGSNRHLGHDWECAASDAGETARTPLQLSIGKFLRVTSEWILSNEIALRGACFSLAHGFSPDSLSLAALRVARCLQTPGSASVSPWLSFEPQAVSTLPDGSVREQAFLATEASLVSGGALSAGRASIAMVSTEA
eukprot:TRINITY_DN21863_c0_g3_i1.p1 TRINITY_DN21863_c0_g3~~TRINITY_DN21863_c0_g3_i1.p1  ORF type:complete len:496 (-),score=61.48 TRINITY_DN21863_c0_g3_i1:77-1564(-)